MSKLVKATVVAMSLLAIGGLYRTAIRNHSDNLTFQAICANAATVKIDLSSPAPKSKKGIWIRSETLSPHSHPQQLSWFRATNRFSPDYLECPWSGIITVSNPNGTEYRFLYYRGVLQSLDLSRAESPKGTANVNGQLYAWIESIKPKLSVTIRRAPFPKSSPQL